MKAPSPNPWTAREFPDDFYKEKLFPFPRAFKKKVVNIYKAGVYKKQDTSWLHKKRLYWIRRNNFKMKPHHRADEQA